MRITKNQLRRIIKEEIANVLEKASDKDLEEGWWPFGNKKEESPQAKKREKARQMRNYRKARAAAEKKTGITKRREDEEEAKRAALKAANARGDASRKPKQKAARQKEMDAEYDKQQRTAKRKEAEKNKIEHWEFDDGRGSMAVRVNDAKSVAQFHRANGSEIPEWALRALNEKRIQTMRITKKTA